MKVHVVGKETSLTDYHRLLNAFVEPNFEKADLVVFTGGEDINPALYNQLPNSRTSKPNRARDIYETALFRAASKRNTPMLGICRGAQLLCALSGNSLYQHVNNHVYAKPHDIKLFAPLLLNNQKMIETIHIPGDHHQMMRIDRDDTEVLGTAINLNYPRAKVASIVYGSDGEFALSSDRIEEVEIAYFRNTRALGIQAHPEWAQSNSEVKETVLSLLDATVFKK